VGCVLMRDYRRNYGRSNSDACVVMSWRDSFEYSLAEDSFFERKKAKELSYMKPYEIQEVWWESKDLCRAFIEWVKAQDTEELIAGVFHMEEESK
jgi:hypothetical protein